MALTATQQALLKKQQDEKTKLAYQNALGKFTNQGAQSTLGGTGGTAGTTSGGTTGGSSGGRTGAKPAKPETGLKLEDPSPGGTLNIVSEVDSLKQQAADRLAQLKSNNEALKSAYATQQQTIADRNKASIDSQYDTSEKNAYINYMLGQKNQKGQLARLGVTGGGAESMTLGNQLGYENTLGNLASQRIGDKTSVDNAYADAVANYNLSQDAQYQQDYLDEQDKWDEKIEAQEANDKAAAAEKEAAEKSDWVENIAQFDTNDECKTEIARIEKLQETDPAAYEKEKYKINYLEARKAENTAEFRAENQEVWLDTYKGVYNTDKKINAAIDRYRRFIKNSNNDKKIATWKARIRYLTDYKSEL